MKDIEELKTNKKRLILRIIGFALASLIAVGAITYGVIMLSHKDEGYQEIEPYMLDDSTSPPDNVTFNYYFTGKSNEIRQYMNVVKDDYSVAFNRIYKQLDPYNVYSAIVNINTLNKNTGKKTEVSEELYGVLKDAYEKTEKCEGYNMFAGALYYEWNSIIILEDPYEADPLLNENEKERLSKISEQVNDLSNFTLIFDDSVKAVTFDVSEEYKKFIEEYELEDAAVIDLNLLHDAYELKLLADDMNGKGHTNGFFTTVNGVTLALSEHDIGTYHSMQCLYDGKISSAAGAKMTGGSASCQFRNFAAYEGEYCYYSVTDNGKVYNRSPYLPTSGEMNDVLLTSFTYSDKLSVIEVCYANLLLHDRKSIEDVKTTSDGFTDICAAYVLQTDTEKVVHISKKGKDTILPGDGYGWKTAE